MNYAELFKLDLTNKTVLIIGRAASGKSTLAARLSHIWPQHRLVGGFNGLDGYLQHGAIEGLYVALEDITAYQEQGHTMIIEGVAGYRLLRKGVQLDCFYPDIVINLQVSDQQVEHVYRTERDPGKIKNLRAQTLGLETVLRDYRALPNQNPPEWIDVQNNFSPTNTKIKHNQCQEHAK